jgi:hypothetical protein
MKKIISKIKNFLFRNNWIKLFCIENKKFRKYVSWGDLRKCYPLDPNDSTLTVSVFNQSKNTKEVSLFGSIHKMLNYQTDKDVVIECHESSYGAVLMDMLSSSFLTKFHIIYSDSKAINAIQIKSIKSTGSITTRLIQPINYIPKGAVNLITDSIGNLWIDKTTSIELSVPPGSQITFTFDIKMIVGISSIKVNTKERLCGNLQRK